MTYAWLLLLFVVTPIFALTLLTFRDYAQKRGQGRKALGWSPLVILAALVVVATLYTAPWDNHMIAIGVWWYQPALISGIFLGSLPLEELLFFPLQTLLIGLWFIWQAPRFVSQRDIAGAGADGGAGDKAAGSASGSSGAGNARLIATVAGACLWLIALAILWLGWRPGTYLGWELAWALPPMILQVGLGGDILWRYHRLLVAVLVPPVIYLGLVDALAIHEGIWTIDPRQSLGVLIGGQLPLEELVFFTLTSALVAFGLVLGIAIESRRRLRSYHALLALSHERE